MLSLKEIKKGLLAARLSIVSEKTGIHYNTLLNIRDSEDANPTYDILSKLTDYFGKKS